MSQPHRFLHAADLHLDSPFRGLARQAPELAARLRDASLTALDRLVALAIETGCHFVVLAGDLYDGLERGVRAQLALRRAAGRLHEAGIPLVMLHGNHDPLDLGYTAVRSWPESTHLFSARAPEVIRLETPAGRVTLTGQSFPSRHVTTSLAATYPAPEGEGLHVAVLHTEITSGDTPNPYSPTTVDALVRTGFHYWALGHVHDPQVLHRGPPVVAYPGNLQGRHFLECGPRGALLVEGTPHDLTVNHQSLAPFVFERVRLDVGRLADLAVVQAELLGAIPASSATLLLRAELTGRSSLFEPLHDGEQRAELLAALNEATGVDTVWMELRSEVRPDLPWSSLADQPGLAGALVRQVPDPEEARAALREVRRLGDFAAELDARDLDDLIRRALYRAVDALHAGEP